MKYSDKIKFATHVIGLKTMLRTLIYSIYRDWANLRYRKGGILNQRKTPGSRENLEQTETGVQIGFGDLTLEINFLMADLVRVQWTPGQEPNPYAIDKLDWEPVEIEIRNAESSGVLTLISELLSVNIFPDGTLTFSQPDGSPLHHQEPPVREGAVWVQRSPLRSEERIYGLGERAAPFNLRPGQYHMWNQDPGGSYGPGTDPLYMGIPTYLGMHKEGSYILFYENSFPGLFHFAEGTTVRFNDGALRYYFIGGPPDNALDRYTMLTGRPLLPPRWALGYHQSRWGYVNEAQVQQVVDGFERNDLPLDVLHLDIDYMDGYRLFTVDKKRFPNLPRLVRDLNKRDIKVVPILDCGVKIDPKYPVYKQGLDRGMFCKLPNGKPAKALVWPGWSVFPDFTDSEVRAWWMDQYRRLLSMGMAGIWHDMNEPAAFVSWGQPTLPRVTRHSMEGRGGDHEEAHNLYGLLMAKAGYEGLKKYRPDKRPWLLTRSGWAGIQRYSWHWTGDTQTSWAMLRHTLHALLGLGLSGVPFSGSDIGGFSGSPSPELFLRWFQFSAFTPFFRNHAAMTTPPREPWHFGKEIQDIIRKFLLLRKQLVPYLYTQAWEVSQSGKPILRPLFWADFNDERLVEVDDSFLLGPDILVAPVLEQGAKSRSVCLPGGDWYDYWTNTCYEGNCTLEVPLNWTTIPLFVRAGSVLPLGGEDTIVLTVYASQSGDDQGCLFSDAGDGYGPTRFDCFRIHEADDRMTIQWDQIHNEYLFPYPKIILKLIGREIDKAWVDGEQVPVEGNQITVGFFESVRFRINK